MSKILLKGFEEQQEPIKWKEPTSTPTPSGQLESFLADSTIGALAAGAPWTRAEVGLLLPEACFAVKPVEGDPHSWTIRVIPYPDPIVRGDVPQLWLDLFSPTKPSNEEGN